jgi:hypothetical protein
MILSYVGRPQTMLEIPDFGSDFIKKWEQKHYKCDKDYEDEGEYQKLVQLTNDDVTKLGIVSEKTLRRILKWKDKRERVERKVNWGKYDSVYAERFRLIISEGISDHHKLLILIWDEDKLNKLPVTAGKLENIRGKAEGFGPPVASTILHFIFSDRFPIIDIRTAEVMYFADRIKSTNRNDYRLYDPFRSSVLQISENTGYSVHKIDRAIFAFHRDALQPEMNQGRGLPLDAPWKLRQMWIDRIRAEANNQQK